jgi:hypothetical protein
MCFQQNYVQLSNEIALPFPGRILAKLGICFWGRICTSGFTFPLIGSVKSPIQGLALGISLAHELYGRLESDITALRQC